VNRHRQTHPSRSLMACALAVTASALSLCPAAVASSGAVDQYTEQPPTGPGGNDSNLSTGGTDQSHAGGGSGAGAGAPAEGGSASGDSTASGNGSAEGAPAAGEASSGPSSPESASSGPRDRATDARAKISAVSAISDSTDQAPAGAAGTFSEADDPTLPILDYPVTPLLLVLGALGLASVVLAAGLTAYRRVRRVESPST
jgi:hypothetical protein